MTEREILLRLKQSGALASIEQIKAQFDTPEFRQAVAVHKEVLDHLNATGATRAMADVAAHLRPSLPPPAMLSEISSIARDFARNNPIPRELLDSFATSVAFSIPSGAVDAARAILSAAAPASADFAAYLDSAMAAARPAVERVTREAIESGLAAGRDAAEIAEDLVEETAATAERAADLAGDQGVGGAAVDKWIDQLAISLGSATAFDRIQEAAGDDLWLALLLIVWMTHFGRGIARRLK